MDQCKKHGQFYVLLANMTKYIQNDNRDRGSDDFQDHTWRFSSVMDLDGTDLIGSSLTDISSPHILRKIYYEGREADQQKGGW